MNFNITKFLEDFSIPYWTEGTNTAKGWINIQCPLCPEGDSSNHLGFNIKDNYWRCWRCGHHWPEKVIMELTDLSFLESKKAIREYSNNLLQQPEEQKIIKQKNKTLSLPTEAKELNERHKQYLRDRNFKPILLENEFNLKGTNHLGDYKFRIIAPIYFNGKLVSYQGRDITGKQTPKYKACKKELETTHHKHILYNRDNCKKNIVVVCEGITDVWRLGHNSVATFGTGFTQQQINLLAKKFKKIIIFYDKEQEAQKKAQELSLILNGLGKTVFIIEGAINDDPANMSQDDADYFMKEIIK